MVEALISGALCILSLYYAFICGIKIIQTTLQEEKLEEQFIHSQKF